MTLGFPASVAITDPDARAQAPVMSRRGAIASAHPLISATGLRTLAEGGNAVDAAIAAALTGSVVLPAMCGLGGDLFALVHRPASSNAAGVHELLAFQGSGVGPGAVSFDWMAERGEDSPYGNRVMAQHGPLSPGVPGFIAGAFDVLSRFGSRSFGELAAPAIGYARDGFPLSAVGAAMISGRAEFLARTPASAAVFLANGPAPQPGSLLKQPDLARSMEQIAAGGAEVFYKGDIARRITAFLAANGGALSADDFAAHATDITPPLATTYRNYTVYETNLPTQGFVVLEALNILDEVVIGPAALTDSMGVHLAAEALKAAFADRNAFAGDPRAGEVPLDQLLSKAWAKSRLREIDRSRASEMRAGSLQAAHTTSLCVIDGDGLMISLIFSVSDWFGSGVVAGDTGILLNNRAGHCFNLEAGHPNCFAPGKRPMHTLNCYLVADPDGTPVVVGGTPGGDFQPQWNIQTLSGLIDGGLDVQKAAALPRWQLWPATYPAEIGGPAELRVENRIGPVAINELERMGHNVVRLSDYGAGGSVQVIARDPETGVIAAGSDPHSEGLAIGL